MTIQKVEIFSTLRVLSSVAKLTGGDDLIHFSLDRISARSHIVDVDRLVPGMDITATVSAKYLVNALKDMSSGELTIRSTPEYLTITDGVRKAKLKKKDIADGRILTSDYSEMDGLSAQFWDVLEHCVFDGTGNKGIQFLGSKAVNRTNAEMQIWDIESPSFYLGADQVSVLHGLCMHTDTRILCTDNTIKFSDAVSVVECRRGVVHAALTSDSLHAFQTKTLTNGIPVYSSVLAEGISVALKHVSSFGEDDADTGNSVAIIFNPENKQVILRGTNSVGSFEEIVDMEYSGTESINISVSVAVLYSLVGRSFSLLQRPDNGNHYWFVSEDKERSLLYIGGGKNI